MNAKVLIGGLLGGIVLFVLGGLFYVLLFADFFAAPADRAEPLMLFIGLGEIVSGILLAWVLSRFGVTNPAGGAKDGAMFGLILWLGISLTLYGAYEMYDLTVHFADAIVGAVRYGVAGGVVGWWLGRGASSA